MRVVRLALPAGIAVAVFCPKRAIVVDSSLSEAAATTAVAMAQARCDGLLFVVVFTKELMRAA